MKTPQFYLLLLAFVLTYPIEAQNIFPTPTVSKVHLRKQMKLIHLENSSLTINTFFDEEGRNMGLGEDDKMRPLKIIEGKNGFQHHRFRQFYKQLPVFGSQYILHVQNGFVKSVSGDYLPMIQLPIQADFSKERAIDIAQRALQQQNEAGWQMNDYKSLNLEPMAELVIADRAFPDNSERYVLAYSVVVYRVNPYDKWHYLIDAKTETILSASSSICCNAVPAHGQTRYYGQQTFMTDSIAPNQFELRDPTRNGNMVFNAVQETFQDANNYWDLENEEMDEVAIDAHYCTSKFHDLMLNQFNWNGIDNEGKAMNCMVHAGDFVNAFWNGEFAAFGDGGCMHGPLTTLDVVGHEFMHGITQHTSELVYFGECGAINESLSDIFGKALEYYEDTNNFSWNIGAQFIESDFALPFRSFENPYSHEHPKFYEGLYWDDLEYAVHTNSSVGNHWFYLLVNGGSGANEAAEFYNVESIGMDAALQIVFLTQTAYLVSTSKYIQFHQFSVEAATEIFGANSTQVEAVQEAWKAVGVPAESETIPSAKLRITYFFDENVYCQSSENFPIQGYISNIGEEDYIPEGTEKIRLLVSTPNNEITDYHFLNAPIPAGTLLPFEFLNSFNLNTPGEYGIKVAIELDNSGEYLHFYSNTIRVFENNAQDFILLSVSEDPINPCVDNNYQIEMSIRNGSCQVIPTGTVFTFLFTHQESGAENIVEIPLEYDLKGNRRWYPEITLEMDFGEYLVELISPEDDNSSTNDRTVSVEPFPIIQDVYATTFDETDEYMEPNLVSYSSLLPYENNYVWGISGSNWPYVTCPDATQNFTGEQSTFSFCLDLESLPVATLGFDLLQFRNENGVDFPELEIYTNIVRCTWTSEDENYSEYIYGQPEGVFQHHEYALPENFKGRLDMEFFLSDGNIYNPVEQYPINDIALVDNLQISDTPVHVSDLQEINLQISPNPTTGWVQIRHPYLPEQLRLMNLQGQTLIAQQTSSEVQELDLSNLADGCYILQVDYGAKGMRSEKIILLGR